MSPTSVTRTTIAVVVVIIALAALPVVAQEAVSPRFFIEKIEVRNTSRVSPDVVVAESRLREGADYSEAELRDAAARLTRLPFLLNAEFALERGSERGRHVLVIDVAETRSLFFHLDVVPVIEQRPNLSVDIASQLGGDETSIAAGYRWFIGRRGALHLALIGRHPTEFTQGYTAFAVGWTQYDLFGTRAFATLNIKDSPEVGTSPQLVVGVPLSLNQTLTAEYDELVIDYDVNYAIEDTHNDRETQRVARLTWSYNTTNHPVLPTEGTLFSAGPIATWRDEMTTLGFATEEGFSYQFLPIHTTIVGVEASALRYWEISDRNSVNLGVATRFGNFDRRYSYSEGRSERNYNSLTGVAQAGISRSLWSAEKRASGGDSRIELNVRGQVRDNTIDLEDRLRRDDDNVQATLSWVRHSSWGTFRLGFGGAW